jgi:hypothetical protein
LLSAEALYRGLADDLSLANTLRLLGLIDAEPERWREARRLYVGVAERTNLPLGKAIAECDLRLRG